MGKIQSKVVSYILLAQRLYYFSTLRCLDPTRYPRQLSLTLSEHQYMLDARNKRYKVYHIYALWDYFAAEARTFPVSSVIQKASWLGTTVLAVGMAQDVLGMH